MTKRIVIYNISRFLGAALLFGTVTQANAASISIDDSDPNTYSVSSSNFEFGFSSSPTGNSIPDGTTLTFSGSYISFTIFSQSGDYLIAAASNPNDILAELDLNASNSYGIAAVSGSFYGNNSSHVFSPTGTKVLTGSGGYAVIGAPNLAVYITPEIPAAVPEISTWSMLIGGFGVMGGMVRRRRWSTLRIA